MVGFAPKLTDAELVTLAVISALLGFDNESQFMRYAHAHPVRLRRIRDLSSPVREAAGSWWADRYVCFACSRAIALRMTAKFGSVSLRWLGGAAMRSSVILCPAAISAST